MAPRTCTVCGSPNATNFHFGAQSCKACAAFFRRSVKTGQTYECIGEFTKPCETNHVVQGRSSASTTTANTPTPSVLKRKSSPEVALDDEPPLPAPYTANNNLYYPPPAPSTSRFSPYSAYTQASDNEWEGFHPTPPKSLKMAEDLMEMEELEHFIKVPAVQRNTIADEDRFYALAALYMEQVVHLNMRRKLTYTNNQMSTMFDGWCVCPFNLSDLMPFDIRSYRHRNRNDHTMVLDYINQFPDFEKLNKSEKTVLFQTAAAVDTLVSPAYYSHVVFPNDPIHVTFKGEYIRMDPLPTGELDAEAGDFTPEDLSRNRTLTAMMCRKWLHVSVPLRNLNMSLVEFALFKALTIWHYNYYKLQDNGRQISARQRDEIFRTLLAICADEGHVDPLLRVSELVLAVGIVMAEVHEMVTSFIEIMVFDDVDDPILREMLKFQY
uniref:Nuclear receptor domain-containing protein n=1 Tax=Caenorhabditis japonica TaxID=281687 RepID=A0A8R1DY56_CAEJA